MTGGQARYSRADRVACRARARVQHQDASASRSQPRGDVTADSLRRWCLARPSAVEEFPFGAETSVFKVGGKMFALTALDTRPLTVSLKCEPSLAGALRAEHSAVRHGYHLNKRHWITVTLDDSLPDELVLGLLEDSYELVVDDCRSASATSFARPRRSRGPDAARNRRPRLVSAEPPSPPCRRRPHRRTRGEDVRAPCAS
jgi:predicted DNA-binding protein (MmcQ/YjbR family)